MNLYGNTNLEEPTTKFDDCGLILDSGDTSSGLPVVIPSLEWGSAMEFFNDPTLKPPLFGDYALIIDKSADRTNCFNAGLQLGLGIITAMSATLYVSF